MVRRMSAIYLLLLLLLLLLLKLDNGLRIK